MQHNWRSIAPLGKELLACALRIAVDDRHCRVENVLRGAVVLLKQNHKRTRMIFLKAEHVAVVRTAPAVNGLIRVAHHIQAIVNGRQQLHNAVLHKIRVLKFVYQHMLKLALAALERFRHPLEQLRSMQQQVIKVGCVVFAKQLLIAHVNARHNLVQVAVGQKVRSQHHFIFGARDGAQQALRREALLVYVQVLAGLLEQSHLVGGVVDCKVARELKPGGCLQRIRFAPQNARTGGVKCAHPVARERHAQLRADALAHLLGCFVGEGDGHHAMRGCAVLHKMRHALREHGRLARARPGQHEHRASGRGDSAQLLRVQTTACFHRRRASILAAQLNFPNAAATADKSECLQLK